MSTIVTGSLFSDSQVGAKEDVTDVIMEYTPFDFPLLNAINFTGAGVAHNVTHTYLDDAYVPTMTTLNGTITNSDQTIVITHALAHAGCILVIDSEQILVGTSSDGLTCGTCTRTYGTTAAAAHTTGTPVMIIPAPAVQAAALGTSAPNRQARSNVNYCQTFIRPIVVADEANNTAQYGVTNPYDRAVQQNSRFILADIQNAFVAGVKVAPAPTSGTQARVGGIMEAVIGAGNTTNLGGADLTQADLIKCLETTGNFAQGEVAAILAMPTRQTLQVQQWNLPHVSGPDTGIYGTNTTMVRLGGFNIALATMPSLVGNAVFIQPQFLKPVKLGGMGIQHEVFARDGLRQRGALYGSYSLEINCPEAHWVFTGVKQSA